MIFTPKNFKAICLIAVGLSSSLALADSRWDQIVQSKTLRVGTPGDYRPFAMKNTDKQYIGHDIDVIEKMAEEMNVKVVYVDTTWPNLMGDLKNNRFDVAIGGITRTVQRLSQADMLPAYAPFGKVALVQKQNKNRYHHLADLNQANIKVIKNPGGTNEAFVLKNLSKANIVTHDKNAEIPGLIAKGEGDVMITETYEALYYAKQNPKLYAAFIDKSLTPTHSQGFLLPTDDADFIRVMNFTWDVLKQRGYLNEMHKKWLE